MLAEEAAQSVVRSSKIGAPCQSEHRWKYHYDLSDLISLDWKKATELYDQDQVIELVVSGCNRGGLLVHGEGLQGFVPVSHLVETPCSDTDMEKWLQPYSTSRWL